MNKEVTGALVLVFVVLVGLGWVFFLWWRSVWFNFSNTACVGIVEASTFRGDDLISQRVSVRCPACYAVVTITLDVTSKEIPFWDEWKKAMKANSTVEVDAMAGRGECSCGESVIVTVLV